jgi:hypothetical protein
VQSDGATEPWRGLPDDVEVVVVVVARRDRHRDVLAVLAGGLPHLRGVGGEGSGRAGVPRYTSAVSMLG